MCVIIYKKEGVDNLTEQDFIYAQETNPDGMGMMYLQDGRIHWETSIDKPEKQLELYNNLKDEADVWALHLRIMTKGAIDLDNCHPYKILDIDDGDPIDLYMMHNGTFSNYLEEDKAMSDSWNFANAMLKPLLKENHELLYKEEFQHLLEDFAGSNKVLFMDSNGEVILINETLWKEHEELMCSNLYSFGKATTKATATAAGGTGSSSRSNYNSYYNNLPSVNRPSPNSTVPKSCNSNVVPLAIDDGDPLCGIDDGITSHAEDKWLEDFLEQRDAVEELKEQAEHLKTSYESMSMQDLFFEAMEYPDEMALFVGHILGKDLTDGLHYYSDTPSTIH